MNTNQALTLSSRAASLALAILAILFLGLSSHAQETATISGTTVDKTGAVVANVAVTATNSATGLRREATTNAQGTFTLSSLPVGTYSVEGKAQGFRAQKITDIVLHARDQLSLTLDMQVGAVSETINVTAEAALIKSESGDVATVVDRQFVANMPLNGRSFQSLITLVPGVVTTSTQGGPGQFSVNGQRNDANYFMIDGVSANVGGGNGLGTEGPAGAGSGVQTSGSGGYNNMVSVDALQEFKIETNNFAAEYGRLPGGQVILTTRSGTNRIHGDVFEYLRNEALDANNWFNRHSGLAKPPERQNDFGGVVGGPIWKNKLFFFGSYEGQRLAVPTTVIGVGVPSLAARQNAVAAVKPFLNAYPLPTSQCAPAGPTCDTNVGLLNASFSNKNVLDAGSLRVDWNASKKMTIFGRYNDAPSYAVSRAAQPASQYTINSFGLKTLTLGQTYVLKSNMISDLRANYSFAPSTARGFLDNFGGAVPFTPESVFTTPGFTQANSSFIFNAASVGSVGYSASGNDKSTQYNVIENISWVHGNHQMKFGVDYRKIIPVDLAVSFLQQYIYSAPTTNWVNNTPSTYATQNQPPKSFYYRNTGVYAQDSWKLTPRLTLNYGLRWDVNPAPGAAPGHHLQALNQVLDATLTGTHVLPDGTPIYATQWNAFAPRFGFAYQLSKDPNWGRVIRGGYGLFFDTGGLGTGFSLVQFASAIFNAASNPKITPFPEPANIAVQPQPVTAPPWGFVSTTNPHFRMPYTHQANLAIEQSLGSSQTVSLTYTGAFGRDLPRRDQYSTTAAINPDFAAQGAYAMGNESWSDYNALQFQYQRRLSHGLQAMAAYTYSHSTDTSSAIAGTNSINAFMEPVTDYYGNSDFDIRHAFQTAVSYNIPSPSQNPFVRAILGSWGADGTFRIRSAVPIDLTESSVFIAQGLPFLPGTTTTNPAGQKVTTRPILAAGAGTTIPFFISNPTAPGGKVINPAAFVLLPINSTVSGQGVSALAPNGTLGRNYLRGFGWNQIDLSLRRDFPVHESVKLQLRADFFNLFNHPSFNYSTSFFGTSPLDLRQSNFGSANSTLNNGLSGVALVPAGQSSLFQIGGPRSIQIALKLVF